MDLWDNRGLYTPCPSEADANPSYFEYGRAPPALEDHRCLQYSCLEINRYLEAATRDCIGASLALTCRATLPTTRLGDVEISRSIV